MQPGEKFIPKCPVCNSALDEVGIGKDDNRLYYSCNFETKVRRTRLEPDRAVRRRLNKTLENFVSGISRYGHEWRSGRFSQNLVWVPIRGGVAGDDEASIFCRFFYRMEGDIIVPLVKSEGPGFRMPDEATEVTDWEWTDKNRTPVDEERDPGFKIKTEDSRKEKKPSAPGDNGDPRATRGSGNKHRGGWRKEDA